MTVGKAGHYWHRPSLPADETNETVLVFEGESSGELAFPAGFRSLKAWVISPGSTTGISGSLVYRTWNNVAVGSVISYHASPAGVFYDAETTSTSTVTLLDVTIEAQRGVFPGEAPGGEGGPGDGGFGFTDPVDAAEDPENAPLVISNGVSVEYRYGGALGGNGGYVLPCNRMRPTGISDLIDLVALTGQKTSESCGYSGAFGHGGSGPHYGMNHYSGMNPMPTLQVYQAGIGGGAGGGGNGVPAKAGNGAVVLYFIK